LCPGPSIEKGLEHLFVFQGGIKPSWRDGHVIVGIKAGVDHAEKGINFLSNEHQGGEDVVKSDVRLIPFIAIDEYANTALRSGCIAHLVALVEPEYVIEIGFEDLAVQWSEFGLCPLHFLGLL